MLKQITSSIIKYYYKVMSWLSDRYYFYIKNRHHIIKIKIKPTPYIDSDILMLYANMTILQNYIDYEKPFELIDWEHNETYSQVKRDIQRIYDWWKNYEKRKNEIDNILHEWFEINRKHECITEKLDTECFSILKIPFENKELENKEKELFDKYNKLEDKLAQEEQEMLIKLIKIRKFLWT